MGASTAEQATQSNEDTWGLLPEEYLKKELPSRNVEVGIYATGGLKTHELFRWVNRDLVSLELDLVITMLGINNLSTDMMYLNQGREERLMEYIEEKEGASVRRLGFLKSRDTLSIFNIMRNASSIPVKIMGRTLMSHDSNISALSITARRFRRRLLSSQLNYLAVKCHGYFNS